MTIKQFLHVGCGPTDKRMTLPLFNTDDWHEVRFDIDTACNPDIIGTMTDMSLVADGSMSALYSAHNIEHLYAHEVAIALAEFRRVLANDGFAVITCPDLKSVCQKVLATGLTEPAYLSAVGPIAPMDILFGHGEAIANGKTYMAHRCGFTKDVLDRQLLSAGFAQVFSLERPENFDLWAVAFKHQWPEEQARDLFSRLFSGRT